MYIRDLTQLEWHLFDSKILSVVRGFSNVSLELHERL